MSLLHPGNFHLHHLHLQKDGLVEAEENLPVLQVRPGSGNEADYAEQEPRRGQHGTRGRRDEFLGGENFSTNNQQLGQCVATVNATEMKDAKNRIE